MNNNFNNQNETYEFVYQKPFNKKEENKQDVNISNSESEVIEYNVIKNKKNKLITGFILILILIILFLGGIIYYSWSVGDLKLPKFVTGEQILKAPESIVLHDPDEGGVLSAEEIYSKVNKSVIGIAQYDTNNAFSDLVGQGSGVVLNLEGYIVTNSHVVGDSSKNKITAIFKKDGKTIELDAVVVGFDRKTDLAVIKIDTKNKDIELIPAEFANSDGLNPGATCYAIGNPVGIEFYSSITKGIISSVDRKMRHNNDIGFELSYIQFDAAVNPGNSGGGLFNSHGKLIGINSAKFSALEVEGMGFAIPSSFAQNICNLLISNGYIKGRGCIGIVCSQISEVQAQLHNVPTGARIVKINTNSDSNGKIKVNDIIIKIDNILVTNLGVISSAVAKKKPGDEVELEIFRKNNSLVYRDNSETFTIKCKIIEDKNYED